MVVAMLAMLAVAVPPPEKETVTISGTVKYGGRIRTRLPTVQMTPDCLECHPQKPLRDDLVADRKTKALKWAFVYIKAGIKGDFKPPKKPVVIDQKGCFYKPHVVGVQVGQTLRTLNSDKMMHNVHTLPFLNAERNGSTVPGGRFDRLFKNPEVMVKVKCGVHPWMGAWIGVLDHPFFAVTKADGTYEIKGLPSGKYTIAAWHEKTGTVEKVIEVKASATVDFTLAPPKKKKAKK